MASIIFINNQGLKPPMNVVLEDLAAFLVRAKKFTYAGNGRDVPPQRPNFREMAYHEGDWDYRDSYAGFYRAPGQEIVRFQGKPVWVLAYSGGMLPEYHGQFKLAQETFTFLKKALWRVEESQPFRGPPEFSEGKFKYVNSNEGDITFFFGQERIRLEDREIFRQYYHGSGIVSR